MQPNLEEPQQPKTGAVRSMTGYGRARQLIGSKEITVEIRSVNHRFLEYSSRVPRAYAYLEEKLKNLIKGSVSRGKVDVSLSIQTVGGTVWRRICRLKTTSPSRRWRAFRTSSA